MDEWWAEKSLLRVHRDSSLVWFTTTQCVSIYTGAYIIHRAERQRRRVATINEVVSHNKKCDITTITVNKPPGALQIYAPRV